MDISDYITQTGLGEYYGVTRNVIGKWLIQAEVRDKRGNPINEGLDLTLETIAPNGFTPFHVWHRDSTIRLLDAMGHRRIKKLPTDTPTYSGAYRPGKGENP